MDASAPTTRIQHVVQVPSDVLVATHAAEDLAAEAGFSAHERAEICLAVRELATNILKHAGEGTITVTVGDEGLEVEAVDSGPGIPNVERAVTDGYSTVGSLGYGLGTVNRVMDDMHVTSVRGQGTAVVTRRAMKAPQSVGTPSPFDIGVCSVPKSGYDENGDSFVVRSWGTKVLVGVIDGVGHGAPAQVAAQAARRYIESHYDQPLDGIFRGTGIACRGTRGVVLALARFDWKAQTLEYASVGNIEARVVGAERPINFIVRRGIIGVNAPPPRVTSHTWPAGAMLILWSDGVQAHWGPDALVGLEDASASVIAQRIESQHSRQTDDATVLVVRQARA
jgi:anti-sigma regulatory factor (Ser/Thr protein kinase)